MLLVKLVSSLMAVSFRLSTYDGPLFDDPTIYHNTMDNLQYLSFTRLDVSFAVNKACQFMYSPRESHGHAVKRNLQYLKHTASFGLHLTSLLSLRSMLLRMLTRRVAPMTDTTLVFIF